MNAPKITLSMACFGRPQRTKRSIECIINQDINNWEAFIMGDGCPDFQEFINSGYLEQVKKEQELKGNIVHYFNAEKRGGGCGYELINHAIQNATGKYLVFYANDDIILPNHFSNYLEIENTDLDYMYFNSWIDPIQQERISSLRPSLIGHSEIILKTELARDLPPHTNVYGHDWHFIQQMIKSGKGRKSSNNILSYKVMHVPSYGTRDTIN